MIFSFFSGNDLGGYATAVTAAAATGLAMGRYITNRKKEREEEKEKLADAVAQVHAEKIEEQTRLTQLEHAMLGTEATPWEPKRSGFIEQLSANTEATKQLADLVNQIQEKLYLHEKDVHK